MKSLQKIQFLELHLLQMKHLLHQKLHHLQNNQSLHLIRLLLKMLMMKWIILLLAQKEVVVMIALMRNQIVLEQKSQPLVSQPVGRMALLCQKEGKGGDLPKISSFPANAPQPRGREPSQGDKSPRRNPRFATNTNEGSVTGEQGPNGRDRSPIQHLNCEKPKVANKPSHLSKSKTNKNSNA